MYEELINSLKSVCYGCKMWDSEKCCLKGDCLDQTRLEAADAIEELQDTVQAQDKALKECARQFAKQWISVSERLPEPNAVDKHGFAKGYLVKTDRHVMMHTARYNGEWWIIWGKAEVITDTVTHWMPLPEPPKDGENINVTTKKDGD